MAAHKAPPSLGFSRQEYWSGLPLPSPMHESEKWKHSCSVMSDSSQPHGLQPTRLLHPWDFPRKSTGVGCHCLLRPSGSILTLFWMGRIPTYQRRKNSLGNWSKGTKISKRWSHKCLLSTNYVPDTYFTYRLQRPVEFYDMAILTPH